MLQRKWILTPIVMTLFIGLFSTLAGAVDSGLAAPQALVRGSQLMTPQERAAHREKMLAASSMEERAQVRAEEHALMQQRAAAQGLTLPPTPLSRAGMGNGMGPGGGRNR
jgi:hypothetical protein